MTAVILALASWAGDRADATVIGYWFRAATTDDPTGKYEALTLGLMAIDDNQYTRKRADLIGLLYGSLLGQNVPGQVKRHARRTLARMDGLDSSVDAILRLAGAYKAAAAAKKQTDQSAFKVGGRTKLFPTGRPWPDEERLVDDLIAALWTQKSGGRSHFSGGFSRFTPPVGTTGRGFSR